MKYEKIMLQAMANQIMLMRKLPGDSPEYTSFMITLSMNTGLNTRELERRIAAMAEGRFEE